jgi:hypothetical protein
MSFVLDGEFIVDKGSSKSKVELIMNSYVGG